MVRVTDTQAATPAERTTPPQQAGEEAKTSTYASTAFKIVAFPFQAAATLTKNTISVITSVALAILGIPGRVFNAAKGLLFSAKTEESNEANEAESTETEAPTSVLAKLENFAVRAKATVGDLAARVQAATKDFAIRTKATVENLGEPTKRKIAGLGFAAIVVGIAGHAYFHLGAAVQNAASLVPFSPLAETLLGQCPVEVIA